MLSAYAAPPSIQGKIFRCDQGGEPVGPVAPIGGVSRVRFGRARRDCDPDLANIGGGCGARARPVQVVKRKGLDMVGYGLTAPIGIS